MNIIIAESKKVVDYYNANLDFTKLQALKIRENTEWNNSYYPVIFASEEQLLKVQKELNCHEIFPRRYFYPSLNKIEYTKRYQIKMPVSESTASRIICLPLYVGLKEDELLKIITIINKMI
jgi:dTDP-4-amino-4,6-dideoxygalactose transaminase